MVAGAIALFVLLIVLSDSKKNSPYVMPAAAPEPSEKRRVAGSHEASAGVIKRTPSSDDVRVYTNQDWRFSFEYPKGWVVSDPKSINDLSLFFISLSDPNPHFIEPALLNIVPDWWGKKMLREHTDATFEVADFGSVIYSWNSIDSGIKTKEFFIQATKEYWINISGKIGFENNPGYATELELVRSTFQFHEPLPTLDELGIEPWIPDYVEERYGIAP